MSGHSKWHNIQGRKNAQDAKRGKIFQKISRDLYQAAKAGDPDPANNAQLRLVIDKAHAANMPASAVRSAFSHSGGSLGASGSVSYMFDRKGLIEILRDDLDKSEDDMLMDALDAGAEDMKATEEKFQIFTDPSSMTDVRDALQEQGYELDTAEVTMIPQNRTEVPADKAKQYRHLIDELTENDDVADIYETGILPDEADDEE